MKKLVIALAGGAVFAAAAMASSMDDTPEIDTAEEFQATCEAILTGEGQDTAGCGCLAEQAMADPAVAEGLLAIAEIAGHENRVFAAAPPAQAALMACFPG